MTHYEYIEPVKELIGTNLKFNFYFHGNKSVDISEYLGYSSAVLVGPIKWGLRRNIFSIESYYINWKFEVIKKETVEFKHKYGYTINPDTLKTYTTLKWKIVRLK
jgi:hypothetical protein